MNFNLTGDQTTTTTPPLPPNTLTITPSSHALSLTIQSTKFMEWTNDDALELIEQYRSHTELWNRADPKYKDKLCRFRAWSEIAERFGCSKAEVERKMNVLLTQYRREKHKMLVKLYQGIQPNPSKWYAFKRFDFMEAGGGTSASLLVTASSIGTSSTHTLVSGSSSSTQAAVAAAAALNGLSTSFDPANRTGTIGNTSALTSPHHRRIKSKELKYFGAMGLNLPMLLSNSRTLDSWSSAGQYSPPISSERQLPTNVSTLSSHNMRVQIPTITAFPNLTTNPQELSIGSRSLFGGSSNNSEPTASPHKAIDLIEVDDNKTEKKAKHEGGMENLPNMQDNTTTTYNNNNNNNTAFRNSTSASGEVENMHSSPVINTNEAHSHQPTSQVLHPNHPPPHTHTLIASRTSREPDDMEIKQELVDYFHATPLLTAGGGTGSQRSYSSNEEIRNSVDEYAQDLRVAASKGLEFGNFVLPRNLRPARSSPTESLEEKYTPLNMHQINATNSANVANTAAGNMLINSILSNESTSEDNTNNSARLKRSASQDAAAAAAIYAESLTPRDDCDYVGSNVTFKLRAMDRTQRIIAEKLISEVLFYGQFNELERSARIQPK